MVLVFIVGLLLGGIIGFFVCGILTVSSRASDASSAWDAGFAAGKQGLLKD